MSNSFGNLRFGFWRYDRSNPAIPKVITQPIRIKGPVGQQVPVGQVADQVASLAQIMSLPRHQTEIDQVAERIGQGQYLRLYPYARAPDGLAKSPPFAP